jgi:hypothetical protein
LRDIPFDENHEALFSGFYTFDFVFETQVKKEIYLENESASDRKDDEASKSRGLITMTISNVGDITIRTSKSLELWTDE